METLNSASLPIQKQPQSSKVNNMIEELIVWKVDFPIRRIVFGFFSHLFWWKLTIEISGINLLYYTENRQTVERTAYVYKGIITCLTNCPFAPNTVFKKKELFSFSRRKQQLFLKALLAAMTKRDAQNWNEDAVSTIQSFSKLSPPQGRHCWEVSTWPEFVKGQHIKS